MVIGESLGFAFVPPPRMNRGANYARCYCEVGFVFGEFDMRFFIVILVCVFFVSLGFGSAEVFRAADNDEMAWRWDARYMSFSTSAAGTRMELDNQEVIERRIKELKDLGVTVVQLDGLHERNIYLDRYERLVEITKIICDTAHRYGMKVIEHSDVTIMPYRNQSGYGYKLLVNEKFDWFQRDIQYDYVINNPCINNPDFKKHYFDMICDYVGRTGLDGFKLDEIVFSSGRSCGCKYCRAKFAKDTGLSLPDDNTDSFFRFRSGGTALSNINDRRVITWLKWRQETIGDWRLDLRKALSKVNPNTSFLVYTTHYGLTTGYSTFGTGGSIFQAARACDWLGTEIMSRNMYYCPRALFMYRKMYAGLGYWANSPVYGLVYHVDKADIAKAGWALNVMHKQLPLMRSIHGADMSYMGWEDKMMNRYSKPEADIAILFADSSRNWERMAGYLADSAGYSQCLSDEHIQHVFLMEPDLVLEKLKQYKLLIMASSSCISDSQAQAVRDYVAQGGRLLITGHATVLDELGFPRKNFALSDVMNLEYLRGWAPKGCSLRVDSEMIGIPGRAIHAKVIDESKSTVLSELVDGNGKVLGPGAVMTKYGKGVVLYEGVRLGAYNFSAENNPGAGYEDVRKNEVLAEKAVEYVRLIYGGRFKFEADADVPEKIFITTYSQNAGGREQMLVHLLNCTGSVLKAGEIIPATPPKDAWVALEKDVTFEIELGGEIEGGVYSVA